jgi:hypothetical protein
MVYLPTEVFADLFERWVARGRALDAAWDDEGVRRVMRFGTRYRLRAVIPCAAFGAACIVAVAAEMAGNPLGFWLRVVCVFFIFPVFLVSVWHTVGVCTTTVVLSDAEVAVGFGPFGGDALEWSRVSSVTYSALRSDFVIEGEDGRRLRIPAQLDGLRTLCDFFITRLDATMIDPSVRIEMVKLI